MARSGMSIRPKILTVCAGRNLMPLGPMSFALGAILMRHCQICVSRYVSAMIRASL